MVLISYIPVGKFDCFSDRTRPLAHYQTFHYTMSILLKSMGEAGKSSVLTACADGHLCHVFPILVAYVADYPEQCLVACCMENWCPVCKVDPKKQGDHEVNLKRTENETVVILKKFVEWDTSAEFKESFTTTGIRPISPPFWHSLPHTDIPQSFTPDLLHQLHKGVFKDHLVKWCMGILGEDEIDQRFRSMSRLIGLQHFKDGISSVSQWTGSGHKEMEKVFLGLIVNGSADECVMVAVCAVIDFIYLASLQSHTTQTLALLTSALNTFHANKQVFIKLEGCTQDHFNIPKVHSMEHYVEMIVLYGSADSYNTKSPECLHINYTKDAYAATNKKDYVKQMTTWLSWQEAIDWFSSYLDWCLPPTPIPDPDINDNPFPSFNDNIGSLNNHDIPTEQVLHINKLIPKPMQQVPAH